MLHLSQVDFSEYQCWFLMKPKKATREQLKRHNRQLLLRAVYYDLADNRAALAQMTGLAKPTVSDLIAELMEEGLLEEGGLGESTDIGGKRPTLIKFVPTPATSLASRSILPVPTVSSPISLVKSSPATMPTWTRCAAMRHWSCSPK